MKKTHAAYSLDQAHSYCRLFPVTKQILGNQKLKNDRKVKTYLTRWQTTLDTK